MPEWVNDSSMMMDFDEMVCCSTTVQVSSSQRDEETSLDGWRGKS